MKKLIKILKKLFAIFFILFFSLSIARASWLDVPANINATGIINQFISQFTPLQNTNYQNNIKELIAIFNKKQISKEIKSNFTNAFVANIHSKLNNDFGDNYGYATLTFTPEEKSILK
jgi:hypothetical protein